MICGRMNSSDSASQQLVGVQGPDAVKQMEVEHGKPEGRLCRLWQARLIVGPFAPRNVLAK